MPITIIKPNPLTRRKETCKKLFEALGDRLKTDVALAPYTTFGIGGKADFFYPAAKPDELIDAVLTAQKLKVRFFFLGGGSNILVSDSGFKGLVILNQCRNIMVDQNTVTCQSGAILRDVIEQACRYSLSGLEFAVGIPGTVGGAIWGNAGAFGKSVGEVLSKAVILTEMGEIKEVEKDYFRFAYRESRLKTTGEVLLSATFALEKGDKKEIAEKIKENLKEREEKLPLREKSAGCFFKNVVQGDRRISAGLLLDQIGAKGMQVGDAKVSARHANILINAKSAKAQDVRKLACELKKKVKEKFGIKLEKEVVYINWGLSRH
jgi:UDP-N-acetylmuramate dehydrogenase